MKMARAITVRTTTRWLACVMSAVVLTTLVGGAVCAAQPVLRPSDTAPVLRPDNAQPVYRAINAKSVSPTADTLPAPRNTATLPVPRPNDTAPVLRPRDTAAYRLDTTTGHQGTFKFQGIALADGIEPLVKRFPKAAYRYDEFEKRVGLECYAVADSDVADEAIFYFYQDRLYQMQIGYTRARIEATDDNDALRRSLVAQLGIADHAEPAFHSWRRTGWRVDLYTNAADGGALLLVTDTNYERSVNHRIRKMAPKTGTSFGLQRVSWTSQPY
jgi:hypothetical protein